MKLSNLHIERQNNSSRLVCVIETKYETKSNQLWIAIPTEYDWMLSDDVYDAFLIAMLYPAMYYHEQEIVIEGKISNKLYFHVQNYLQHIIKAYNSNVSFVKIKHEGFASAKQVEKHVGTGFTGGMDSFTTIIDRYVSETDTTRKIDMLFFNNFSSHLLAADYSIESEKEIANAYYETHKGYPASIHVPYIKVDSNIFDFWKDRWEFTIRSLANAFMALSMQRGLRYYYVSGELSYREHVINTIDATLYNLEEIAELYLFQHVSTEVMEILNEGAQYSRIEKAYKVAQYEPTYEYLNICTTPRKENGKWNVHNCNYCTKCSHALLILDMLGVLDKYSKVFDVEDYRRRREKLWLESLTGGIKPLYMQDLVDYGAKHGYTEMPSTSDVRRYLCRRKLREIYRKIMHFPQRVFKSSK